MPTLTAACQRVAASLAALESAQAALDRLQRDHDGYRRERDEAQRQSDAVRPGVAVAAADVLRDAETVLAASQRQLDAGKQSVDAANQELAGARRALTAAAHEVAISETQDLFEIFRMQLEQLQRTRARLLGAYLVMPRALTDQEWNEIDCRDLVSAAEMQIGLPVTFLRDINWRSHRAVVDLAEQSFRDHLAQLERGDEAPAAEKAAA